MGLFSAKVFEANVDLYDVVASAESGMEDLPMKAHVDLRPGAEVDFGGLQPLETMVPLAVARLLSMMRREPQHVVPLMEVVAAIGEALSTDDLDRSTFRVRDLVTTDVASLNARAMLGEQGFMEAAMNSSIPVVVDQPPGGKAERNTRLKLWSRRIGGAVRVSYRYPIRSANALITSASLFAMIERVVRSPEHLADVTRVGSALRLVDELWRSAGSPPGIPMKAELQMCMMIIMHLVELVIDAEEDSAAVQP